MRTVITRQVGAEELVRSSLERISKSRHLNAVVAVREVALLEAKAQDKAIRSGKKVGPLAGLPLLVKDIEDAIGLPTRHGSLLSAPSPAQRNSIVPALLTRAGAIAIGKTNVPEFAFEGYTDNRLFGATLNPWGEQWSPGGSSGGSAAALAAGLTPLVTATDSGGSIRIPASLCGLVGLKPTAGRVYTDPQLVSPRLNTVGPLSNRIADLRLLFDLLTRPSHRKRVDRGRFPQHLFASLRFIDGPKVAEPVCALFRAAVRRLEAVLGMEAEWVDAHQIFPSGYEPQDWFTIAGADQAQALGSELIQSRAHLFDPAFRLHMERALEIGQDAYRSAHIRRSRYATELFRFIGNHGVLVTPTILVDGWTPNGQLSGEHRTGVPTWVLNTEPANLTGNPSLALPAGHHPQGMPFGIQLIGPHLVDDDLLDIGEVWEATHPWREVAPGFDPFGD